MNPMEPIHAVTASCGKLNDAAEQEALWDHIAIRLEANS